MKKQILSALMLAACATPTFSHPIGFKPIFDVGMFLTNLVMTPNVLKSWDIPIPQLFIRKKLLEIQRKNYYPSIPLTIAQIGLYIYTVPALWKAYKDYKKNDGKIQVKK